MSQLRTALFLIAALSPSLALSKGGPVWQIGKMSEQLSLTEAQRADFKTIRKAGQPDLQAQRAKLILAKKTLSEAFAAPATTIDQLLLAHEQFAQAKIDMMRLEFARMVEMRNLLTPEQLAKLPKVAPLERNKKPGNGEGDAEDNGAGLK